LKKRLADVFAYAGTQTYDTAESRANKILK